MRRLAIVAAMQQEAQALLAAMPGDAPVRRAGRDFRVGHLCGREVVVVLSGIGKVAAATTTTALLVEGFDVEAVLFTGTAGGVGPAAAVGDIVVADALLQHDMDASPLFPRFEVPLYGTDRFLADPALSATLARCAEAVLAAATRADAATPSGTANPGSPSSSALLRAHLAEFAIAAPQVHRGLIVSGDRFVATAAENTRLRAEHPQALAVEMEGAAMAQVCHDFGVPFAVVRTVSDRADATAHVDFMRFVGEIASRYTLAIVQAWLREVG